MRTLTDWVRLGAALLLVVLGGTVLLFYQKEEFSLLIGIASVGIGLGFLWRSWHRQE